MAENSLKLRKNSEQVQNQMHAIHIQYTIYNIQTKHEREPIKTDKYIAVSYSKKDLKNHAPSQSLFSINH